MNNTIQAGKADYSNRESEWWLADGSLAAGFLFGLCFAIVSLLYIASDQDHRSWRDAARDDRRAATVISVLYLLRASTGTRRDRTGIAAKPRTVRGNRSSIGRFKGGLLWSASATAANGGSSRWSRMSSIC
jgi:hypothetical protein